jgi:predicted transcriptional regulator
MLDIARTSAEAAPTKAQLDTPEGSDDAVARVWGKWGETLDGGFQIVPDVLLRRQSELGLTTADVVVLLHLTMAWWVAGRAPFPRASTIAKRMGASERTVQRSLSRLKAKKLIYRKLQKSDRHGDRLAFDLAPLAARLKEIADTDFVTLQRRRLRTERAEVQTSPLEAARGGASP